MHRLYDRARRLVDALTGRHGRLLVVAILFAGVALRAVWLASRMDDAGGALPVAQTESQRVGASLAAGGGFADPFFAPTGPTAHLSPVFPNVIGLVYRALGTATPAAELALAALSVALVTLSFLGCFLVFRALGASRPARFAALAAVAVLPLQFDLEVRALRVWEAPLLIAALSGLLLWVLRLDRAGTVGWGALAGLAAACAALFLVSPAGGLAGGAVAATLVLRRVPWRRWPAAAALFAGVMLAAVTPWALRNDALLGKPIVTRSNGGLELALAYNDAMYASPDPRAAYLARIDEVHPVASAANVAALRAAGGEAAYFDRLGAETRAWIAAHPDRALTLLGRHARDFLVPPDWFYFTWGRKIAGGVELRRLFVAVTGFVALLALPALIWLDRRYLYVAALLTPLILPYIVVQPILRYRYLIATLTIFLACDALARVWTRVRRSA